MHHFARRTAGFTMALAASGLLVVGCSNDDSDSADATTTVATAGCHQRSDATSTQTRRRLAGAVRSIQAGIAPAELVSATDGRGVWLTLEVADAGTERARLQVAGLATEALPENGPWPAAAFAVSDPNGVLVIITPRAGPPARMLPALATAVG